MSYEPRWYRKQMDSKRFHSFTVTHFETDLWIGVNPDSFQKRMISFCVEKIKLLRNLLDDYITRFPLFRNSLVPLAFDTSAPEIAQEMLLQSQNTGTGPMSCVAGAFAHFMGQELINKFHPKELVIENGGDIFILSEKTIQVAVYAGKSQLSGKIGILVTPDKTPLGICTSSGTVGPSLSFGKADAVMIVCKSTTLADGYATAFANKIHSPDDISNVIESIKKIPEIISALIICDDKFGICGKLKLEIFR